MKLKLRFLFHFSNSFFISVDSTIQRRVMKVGTEAIRNTSGRVFEFGTIYSTICK